MVTRACGSSGTALRNWAGIGRCGEYFTSHVQTTHYHTTTNYYMLYYYTQIFGVHTSCIVLVMMYNLLTTKTSYDLILLRKGTG